MPSGRRIQVVGNSGSGKTRLARRIAVRLDVAHLELDALMHQPDWRPAPDGEFRSAVARFLDAHAVGGWVVDGNYRTQLGDLVRSRTDTVLWLDYPRLVVFPRVLRRTLARLLLRRELWNGNRERLGALLSREPEQNILLWSWSQHRAYRASYEELSRCEPHLNWVRCRTTRDAERWLAAQHR